MTAKEGAVTDVHDGLFHLVYRQQYLEQAKSVAAHDLPLAVCYVETKVA